MHKHRIYVNEEIKNNPLKKKKGYNVLSCSVMSDFLLPHGLQLARLLCPWGCSRKEYWIGLPCRPPGDFPMGIFPQGLYLHLLHLLHWQAGSSPLVPPRKPQFQVSVQFSSVAQSCPTLCALMNCSTPGLPVHHQLPEFTQTHVHQVSDAIQPSHPLSSPSPHAPNPSQHQSVFQ